MADADVVAAIRAAVGAAPGNVALRLHLAELTVDDDPSGALEQCTAVLALEPDNAGALALAARAAESAGDPDRGARYRRMATALGAQPAAVVAGDLDLEHEDELDSFLADVLGRPDLERPSVTLADVGGLEQVKRRLESSFLGPMRNPELRRMYGKSLRGGLLLYGPPGCGKTFLARALAGELGARFFSIGLHDVLDMWLRQSERNVHQIFETALRNAPCVLFLDEVDALGLMRIALTHSSCRNVVVQFLS